MNNSALIGHTGFVGSVLSSQYRFDAKFNSANIDSVVGASFDTVVCAAAPGTMFIANRNPDKDWFLINKLIDRLAELRARKFILISSVAVLADGSSGANEATDVFQRDLAYGRHRRALEEFCQAKFDECLVVRLPALFGPGLRKNFIFDLLNPVPSFLSEQLFQVALQRIEPCLSASLKQLYEYDGETGMLKLNRAALADAPQGAALADALCRVNMSASQFHNPESTYQFYDMTRLWGDIGVASAAGLRYIHLAVAPLRVADVHKFITGIELPHNDAILHREDMRTQHASLWRQEGPYLEEVETVMAKLKAFVASQRALT